MVQNNLRTHEIFGLIFNFIGGMLIGMGLYVTFWAANRPLFFNNLNYLIKGKEFFVFPLFFGLGLLFITFGVIELKEVKPGKRKR